MKKSFIIFFSMFMLLFAAAKSGYGQLTQKNFRLCLDNVTCTDSTLFISKDQLLTAKTITANFNWFTISSASVYIGEGNYTSEIILLHLNGNRFNAKTTEVFKRLAPGMHVTITVEGHNGQNTKVEWSPLDIIITK